MENHFDIIIIGSGPGGYTAAIRAAQLGYKTAIVERYPVLGGTCTNVGCIPAKALLDSSEHFYHAKTKLASHGISFTGLAVDGSRMLARKEEVVRQNISGLNYLMKKNKVAVIRGHASFTGSHRIEVVGEEIVAFTADRFVIATGSKPASLAGVTIDKQRIISSTEALSLPEIPSTLAIIGGGAIGLETASIFQRLGTQVTVIEYASQVIPTMDRELGKELSKVLAKTGMDIRTGCAVQSVVRHDDGDKVTVSLLDQNKNMSEITVPYCLIAVGRKPYTENLGLHNTKVSLDERGRIQTDAQLRTAEPNIYAIGDVVAGPMLAHKAEEDAVYAIETMHGFKSHLRYDLVPSVVYTWPEVASVGLTEEQLKTTGRQYRTGKFPFMASGRARAASDTDGFVKILSDPQYGEVLGIHIMGPRAADLIAIGVAGMHYETTDEELYHMPYAHPTYAEAIKEAALMVSGQGSINL